MTNLIVVSSAVAGALVLVLVLMFQRHRIDWSKQLSSPAWDFTRSWSSNFTAAGTAITYTAIASSLGATVKFKGYPKEVYLAMSAMAAAVSVLSPVVFNVLSTILKAKKYEKASAVAFLISVAMTISALDLQLLVGAALLWELHLLGTISSSLVIPLIIGLVLLSVAMIPYGLFTARETLLKADPAAVKGLGYSAMLAGVDRPDAWHLL